MIRFGRWALRGLLLLLGGWLVNGWLNARAVDRAYEEAYERTRREPDGPPAGAVCSCDDDAPGPCAVHPYNRLSWMVELSNCVHCRAPIRRENLGPWLVVGRLDHGLCDHAPGLSRG